MRGPLFYLSGDFAERNHVTGESQLKPLLDGRW